MRKAVCCTIVLLVALHMLVSPLVQPATAQAAGITCQTGFFGLSVTPATLSELHVVSCSGVVADIFLYAELSSTNPYADYKSTHCYNTTECTLATRAPYRAGFWKEITSASAQGITIAPAERHYFCNAIYFCAERP